MLLGHVVDPGRGDHDAAMAEARHVLTEAWEHVLGAQAKLFLAVAGLDCRW